ncbi:MAG: glycosyltransferase involved in cell wall biosynthesis [Desulforhopalus sp.]|jgi:glycosyltransferase involved in cell wall biosynthesis
MTTQMSSEQLDVLVLAPHPFFINRGTPIDVQLVVRALSERDDTTIDMIVYPEGEDIDLPKVSVYRVPFTRNVKGVRPGFSLKKIYIDFFMVFYTWKKVHSKRYSLIHAGEESVFIAMLMKMIYKIPYIYDIDSSIAQQMVEKNPKLKPIAKIFNWFEARAMKGALANAPVCHALRELCEKNQSSKTVTLHDISQLKNPDLAPTGLVRKEINSEGLILLYCGNLEEYQGVGLLVESMPYVVKEDVKIELVIIGGIPEDIDFYTQKAEALGVGQNVHFLGPRPFDQLDAHLADADILVAPRVKGVNTPMKIFPYLHSGKPVLLTKLYTHTQIVTDEEAYLADANPKAFGAGIVELAKSPELRYKLGKNGRAFVEREHVYTAHKKRVDELYSWVKTQLFT